MVVVGVVGLGLRRAGKVRRCKKKTERPMVSK